MVMKKNSWIIALILVVMGFAILLMQLKLCKPETFWYSVSGNAASVILICGVLGFLEEVISKQDRDKQLRELFGVSSAIKDSGLLDIKIDSQEYSYSQLLSNSDVFYTIMNDGLRWVNTYSAQLKKRFSNKTKVTEFFFVDPNGFFVNALAQKTGRVPDSLRNKIEETVSVLSDLYLNQSSKEGSLKIYYLKNYPTQSIFYTDNIIVTTSYQTSCGRNTVPLFEYKYDKASTNIAKFLYNDLDNVRRESQLIFENGSILEYNQC